MSSGRLREIKKDFEYSDPVLLVEKCLFFFCISQKYDKATTLNYPFFAQSIVCQVIAYEGLKKKNFKLLALKEVAVAY